MRGVLFSAKAEYACLAMLELAARHGDPQPTPLKSIAERHGIPERFLVQILLQLKGAGLVASTRGAAGGYQLTRPPGQITLADVIGVLDGDVTPPTDSPTARPASALAEVLHDVWAEILASRRRILAETTLADLLRRTPPEGDPFYQI